MLGEDSKLSLRQGYGSQCVSSVHTSGVLSSHSLVVSDTNLVINKLRVDQLKSQQFSFLFYENCSWVMCNDSKSVNAEGCPLLHVTPPLFNWVYDLSNLLNVLDNSCN